MGCTRARGQPLVALAVILAGWVGARAVAWNLLPGAPEPVIIAAMDDVPSPLPLPETAPRRGMHAAPATRSPLIAPRPLPAVLPPAWTAAPPPALLPPPPVPLALTSARSDPLPAAEAGANGQTLVAGGHQLLWLAAAAMLPLPADVAARFAAAPPPRTASPPRWSADGWVFLRRGGVPVTFPRLSGGGTYGASQAGAVLRYRLALDDPHRPTVYLRGAGALNGTREQEAALGLAARPLAGFPVAAMAEVRLTRNAQGTSARPAIALVTELPPQRLPLGFTGEAYVQGGYVGGRGGTAFVDGLLRAERGLVDLAGAEVKAGAGAWGAKQRGASRLDVGPVAAVRLRLGDTASARLEADWRFRVAGKAHPGSGPALTLSAGF